MKKRKKCEREKEMKRGRGRKEREKEERRREGGEEKEGGQSCLLGYSKSISLCVLLAFLRKVCYSKLLCLS